MSITWQGNALAIPFKIKGTKLCNHCQESVFNSCLYQSLEHANAIRIQFEAAYTKSASKIYDSHLAGCPWCSTLALSVRSVADYITERDSEDDDADLDFGSFALSHLNCQATVHVSMSYIQAGEGTVFNSLQVQITVTGVDKTLSPLPEIAGDDTIKIDLPLSSNGTDKAVSAMLDSQLI